MQQHQRHTERWGDLLDDDDGELDLGVLLPPPVVVGPDAKGIKKVIEYHGSTARATRSRSPPPRASARCAAQGAPSSDARGPSSGTPPRRPPARGSPWCPLKRSSSTALVPQGATLRNCLLKLIHWLRQMIREVFSWCAEPVGRRVTTGPQSPQQVEEGTPSADGSATPDGASGKSEAYIPLFKRLGADKSGADVMRRRNDENSIRVGNLSEDARDHDLADLFGQFGPLSRVYVAMDRVTGESRGFGFVNFVYREDGERAIKKLNGYGYANLILQVDWSGPRPPRPN
ncbi:hypothetical protein HU200_017128 [Digitaria exilis]|uniref:RRM domain-containing protein n=1 Tax=Digitaria exilis TaxID=1010633 RepID=A0A835KHN0_9POAL|nr:hypothetical protein HU200_017128 [Digitaria exilis]